MESQQPEKPSDKIDWASVLTPGPVWPTPDTPSAGTPITITGLTILKFW